MAGVKGRSGRKVKSLEERKFETDKIKYAAIHKSWEIYFDFINDPQVERNYKLQFAIDVCKRSVPQEIKGEGFGDTKIIIVKSKEENAARSNIRREIPA